MVQTLIDLCFLLNITCVSVDALFCSASALLVAQNNAF